MIIDALRPWTWLHRLPRALLRDSKELAQRFRLGRRVLLATTRVEFSKRYAGSVLGVLWYPLYSALLLGMYCFIYMAIFQQRLADFGSYSYVLFIFSGLIPYLGFSEAISTAANCLKANMHLVKNTIFPVELIPVRSVLVSLAGLAISLTVLVLMIAPSSLVGWHLLYLPVAILLLLLFVLPVAWIVSSLSVLIPDIVYMVNLLLLFFMFVSPIGFRLDQVPDSAKWVVMANPMTYLIESFRYALLGMRELPLWTDALFAAACVVACILAGSFFRRLTPLFADHE